MLRPSIVVLMTVLFDALVAPPSGREAPLACSGGSRVDFMQLVALLRERLPVGVIEARSLFEADATAAGNALATALNSATGSHLFLQGLAPAHHFALLRKHEADLPACVLAVVSAASAPQFVGSLAENLPESVRLLAHWPATLPPPARFGVCDIAELLPRLAPAGAPTGELHRPEDVIHALVRQKRHMDALELAVQALPRLVEGLVGTAGREFQRRGMLGRLHLLLSSLEPPWSGLGETLEWRLVAGVAASDWHGLLPEVDAHLAEWPAPDLRARRAALLPPRDRLEVAREALRLARTPLTLWQAGRLEPDEEAAITLLQESTGLAEDSGLPYEAARSAGSLAERYLHGGNMQACLHWSEWALSLLDAAGAAEPERRARIMNNLAFTQLLVGDTAGSADRLEEAVALLPPAATDVRASSLLTLAALRLEEGDARAAAEACEAAEAGAPRRLLARTVHTRVLIWLRLGETERARAAVEQAGVLAEGEQSAVTDSSRLAAAMFGVIDGTDGAQPVLEAILADRTAGADLRLSAWLYLLPGTDTVPELPPELRASGAALTPRGLKALAAPADVFAPVLQKLGGADVPLKLRAFGQPAASFRGEDIHLPLRLWETLAVIALHKDGIADEELHDVLVRDSGTFGLSALRTHVSRLRALLPVSESPYRLLCGFSFDATEFRQCLRQGDLRGAAGLFTGPFLPRSRAPGILELREQFEGEFEQAALASTDAEPVFLAAERAGDDLLLWERCLELLPAGDPRRSMAAARLELLQRDSH